MLNAREANKRLIAAHKLLLEPTTSREKFNAIRTLLEGISPKLDDLLAKTDEALSTIDKVEEGAIVELSAERLPERDENEKKRKAAVLLLIRSWKQLQGEVERVQAEMQNTNGAQAGGHASMWGRILRGAKGPLGLITVVAVGLVALQQTAVGVTIENRGCATLHPSGSIPVSIPGLSLPKEPIASGSSAHATIPGFTVRVDGTQPGVVTLKVLTYTLGFQLPSGVSDITLDGVSLLQEEREIRLSEIESHTLRLTCS